MPEPDFEKLRHDLLNAGVSPRFVRRTVAELNDHYNDLQREIALQGKSTQAAHILAGEQLGKLDVIATHIKSRTELRRWSYRYPAAGRLALPLLCVAALPIAPLVAGVNHAPVLARWGVILMLSACITASLFLAMQISITLG